MVDIPEQGPGNWIIPGAKKNAFGIQGYELPKAANLDSKNQDIINWNNAMNRVVPQKKTDGKETFLDMVIRDAKRRGE